MDTNEMFKQLLTTNPQFAAFAAQLFQTMQQNGAASSNQGNSNQQMNWNMPTNPMAAMLYNNFMNSMNNQGNNTQSSQNQSQTAVAPAQPDNNKVFLVRKIKSPDEIRPDEIPGNGDINLFLQDDLSVIYGKRWTNNGTVDNLRFVLESDDQKESGNSSSTSKLSINTDVFFEKISEMIDEKLSRFNFPNKNASSKTGNNRKGVEENGV